MNLWKKLASMLLCLALLLSLVPVGAAEAKVIAYEEESLDSEETLGKGEKEWRSYPVEGGKLYFDPATGKITDCDPQVTSAVIPSEIGGVAVTEIGNGAFMYCFDLTYVSIPEGVTSIGDWAFNYCHELATVEIPESVISIGDYAFGLCYKLSNVTLPEKITRIGDNLFRACALMTSVHIPRNVTEIGFDPFQECEGLTEISVDPENPAFCSDEYGVLFNKDRSTLIRCPGGFVGPYTVPDSVSSIADYGFSGCKSLTSVAVGRNVTTIGNSGFSDCVSLETVTLEEGLETIGDSAFHRCLALKEITVPHSVTYVGMYAFWESGLEQVTIGRGVEFIGDNAFSECFSLTGIWVDEDNQVYSSDEAGFLFDKEKTIHLRCPGGYTGEYTLPDGVKTIKKWSFTNRGLTEIILPDSLTTIEEYAFFDCETVKTVALPNSVTTLGEGAFFNCSGLESVTLPDTLRAVPNDLFFDCIALETVTVPNGVISIGKAAFAYCDGLETVYLPGTLMSVGSDAFFCCDKLTDVYYSGSMTEWNRLSIDDGNEALESATVHRGSSDLVAYAVGGGNIYFNPVTGAICNCDETVTSADIPAVIDGIAVSSIGNRAFSENYDLASVTIPQGVRAIGDEAFRGCALTEITVPDTVTDIGAGAFEQCTQLKKAVLSPRMDALSERVFAYCYALEEVSLPEGIVSIGSSVFLYCYELASVTIPHTLESLGENAFTNCSALQTVEISENLASIGERAFCGCTALDGIWVDPANENYSSDAFGVLFDREKTTLIQCPGGYVGEYDIPHSVVTLGDWSFDSCINMTHVNIPETVQTIGEQAFNSSGLQEVRIPHSIEDFGSHAFAWCTDLVKVTIDEGVESIGSYAFFYCIDLSEVSIAESVTDIGKSAFYYCESLETITLPEGITDIGLSTFYDCNSLKEITIPDNVTSIGEGAFRSCDNLTTVTLGEGVTHIGVFAFFLCPNLTTVTLPRGLQCIEYGAFQEGESLTDVYYYGTEADWQAVEMEDSDRRQLTPLLRFLPREAQVVEALQPAHSLSLQSDININYVVSAQTLAEYDSYEIECYIGDSLSVLEAEEKDGLVYFTLTDMTALQMNETVRAEIYAYKDGEAYVSPLDEYSIVTYATNMMNSNAPEQVKRICANLLRYGAASQIYMDYDVENLADAVLTEEQKGWLTDTDTVEFANRYAEHNDLAEPQVKWYGKTLILNSTISLKFVVDATDFEGDSEELELRVTYTDIEGKTQTATAKPAPYGNTGTHWVFVIDSLDASELRAELCCRVYAGDTQVSRTMTYSADSYCNGKTGTLLDLCKALFAYVDEAGAYFG